MFGSFRSRLSQDELHGWGVEVTNPRVPASVKSWRSNLKTQLVRSQDSSSQIMAGQALRLDGSFQYIQASLALSRKWAGVRQFSLESRESGNLTICDHSLLSCIATYCNYSVTTFCNDHLNDLASECHVLLDALMRLCWDGIQQLLTVWRLPLLSPEASALRWYWNPITSHFSFSKTLWSFDCQNSIHMQKDLHFWNVSPVLVDVPSLPGNGTACRNGSGLSGFEDQFKWVERCAVWPHCLALICSDLLSVPFDRKTPTVWPWCLLMLVDACWCLLMHFMAQLCSEMAANPQRRPSAEDCLASRWWAVGCWYFLGCRELQRL